MKKLTKFQLQLMCACMARNLTDCAMFLEGKAHLFRANNVFDDAQEYSDLARLVRKTLAKMDLQKVVPE